jgi:hypothetical protein
MLMNSRDLTTDPMYLKGSVQKLKELCLLQYGLRKKCGTVDHLLGLKNVNVDFQMCLNHAGQRFVCENKKFVQQSHSYRQL